MKTCLAQTTLLIALMLGVNPVYAQTNGKETPTTEKTPTTEDQKFSDSQKFDQVKLQILEVTKELTELGVKSIPEYPKYIDLKSVTAYLEELKTLKTSYMRSHYLTPQN